MHSFMWASLESRARMDTLFLTPREILPAPFCKSSQKRMLLLSFRMGGRRRTSSDFKEASFEAWMKNAIYIYFSGGCRCGAASSRSTLAASCFAKTTSPAAAPLPRLGPPSPSSSCSRPPPSPWRCCEAREGVFRSTKRRTKNQTVRMESYKEMLDCDRNVSLCLMPVARSCRSLNLNFGFLTLRQTIALY